MLAFGARRRIDIVVRMVLIDELAVAITAFGRAVFAQVIIGQGMTERAAAAVAGDLVGVDIDDFGGRDDIAHDALYLAEKPLPILKTIRLASSIEL